MQTISKLDEYVNDAVRYLASFTATAELGDIVKARKIIQDLAAHRICGVADEDAELYLGPGKVSDDLCDSGCLEIALPLWKVAIHLQRAILLDEN